MTVGEAIEMLSEIEDKSLPIKAWDEPEEKYSEVIVFAIMKGLPGGDFVQPILSN